MHVFAHTNRPLCVFCELCRIRMACASWIPLLVQSSFSFWVYSWCFCWSTDVPKINNFAHTTQKRKKHYKGTWEFRGFVGKFALCGWYSNGNFLKGGNIQWDYSASLWASKLRRIRSCLGGNDLKLKDTIGISLSQSITGSLPGKYHLLSAGAVFLTACLFLCWALSADGFQHKSTFRLNICKTED